jgi:hypothetical protein
VDQLDGGWAGRREELQADLEDADLAAKPFDPRAGLRERGHVQGQDESIAR